MAELEVGRGGCPRCGGCGAEFDQWEHWLLSSRIREPYTVRAGASGSIGPRVAEFAAAHHGCAAPTEMVTPGGVRIVDRRHCG